MITAFLGANMTKAQSALLQALTEAKNEHPEALVTRFDDLSFDKARALEALQSENLFGSPNIVVFSGILAHAEGEEFYAKGLNETQNNVYVCESEPSKELVALLKKMGKVEEFPLLKKVEKRENSFAIADAVGNRDKKKAWVEFEKLRRRGASMEEVHGTIFWAVKSMYLVAILPKEEALNTGMKEFTYRNYQNFAKKFLVPELKTKLAELKEMYHRAHRGEGELDIFLEEFLLHL